MDWGERLATGIQELDQQHRDIVNNINAVLEACDRHRSRDVIEDALESLGSSVIEYFRGEERILRERGYHGYTSHRSGHDAFVEEWQQMHDRFDIEGVTPLVLSMLQYNLIEWLLQHMSETDKEWVAPVASPQEFVTA